MSSRAAQSIIFDLLLFLQLSAPAGQVPQFHDADADTKTGEVRFDPFQSVDWQLLAQRDLKDFSLNHPTPEQVSNLKTHLREHPLDESGRTSEIQCASPLEPGMTHGFYYLLSGGALQPLQLLRLDGTMRFALDDQKTAIVPDVFFGQIVAKTAAPPPENAAFVVFSDSALAFTAVSGSNFSAQKVGKQDSYVYKRDGKEWTLSVPDEGLFEVMSVSSFKLGQSEYIYVRWKPDSANNYGGCERQFSLFALGQELKLVANNRSGCDV
jgi:hypothetical protein